MAGLPSASLYACVIQGVVITYLCWILQRHYSHMKLDASNSQRYSELRRTAQTAHQIDTKQAITFTYILLCAVPLVHLIPKWNYTEVVMLWTPPIQNSTTNSAACSALLCSATSWSTSIIVATLIVLLVTMKDTLAATPKHGCCLLRCVLFLFIYLFIFFHSFHWRHSQVMHASLSLAASRQHLPSGYKGDGLYP